jgi:ecotropic viral integration site 5 protein
VNVEEAELWRFNEEFFEINHKSLLNILNTFAYFRRDIGYCQGMNFLAGFFLIFFKSEDKAFFALCSLVSKFNLADVFNLKL